MKPILTCSEITDAVYIVTKYKILEDGVVDAIEKCDVTDQFDAMTESLRAENAKLRELARRAHGCKTDDGCCEDCWGDCGECPIEAEMRALGIEVDG